MMSLSVSFVGPTSLLLVTGLVDGEVYFVRWCRSDITEVSQDSEGGVVGLRFLTPEHWTRVFLKGTE